MTLQVTTDPGGLGLGAARLQQVIQMRPGVPVLRIDVDDPAVLAGGFFMMTEAALEVRLSQLDEEISETEKQLERLKRERDRIGDRLRQNKSELTEQVNEVVNMVENGGFPVENIDPENPAIQNWASDAGVPAERFVDEIESKVMTDGGSDR